MPYKQSWIKNHFATGMLFGLAIALIPTAYPARVIAHAGHGKEFQGGNKSTQTGSIKVDPETAKRMDLKVQAVTAQKLMLGIQATGQIANLPDRKVEVTTPLKGKVVQLFVKPGSVVQAGQVVAILSSPELAELRVSAIEKRAEAEVDLSLAQQNYDRQKQLAVVDIAQAKTELKVAQERYDRDLELQGRGAIPRRQLLESETKLAESKAAVTKAESRFQVLEADAQTKRARSRLQLSNATYKARLSQLGINYDLGTNSDGTIAIKAPIDGTVADREISLGESVEEAGKPLMSIVDNKIVSATANVYEKDLNKVKIGQAVRVKVSGLPNRNFQGKVTVIGAVVDGGTRVVPVTVELDNLNGVLKPGMFAEMEILTERSPEAVVTIPQSAIVEVNGQQIVYVQNGNSYQPVNVAIGRTAGDLVEVKDGLFEGDLVVTQRGMQLYAQSLRGGNKTEESHSESVPETNSAVVSGIAQIPWWAVLPVGGAIAAGAFWLGRRSSTQLATVSNVHANINANNGNNGAKVNGKGKNADIDFDNSQHQGDRKDLTASEIPLEEDLEDPRQNY
jgi:membrane fusion protein, heavy metal efflux system